MKNPTLNYVCCDRCHARGKKPKEDITSTLAVNSSGKVKSRYITALYDLWNGFVYRMPLCCNIKFCYLVAKGLRPAIVTGTLRGEPGWNKTKLSTNEVKYINSKYYGGRE